MKKNLLLLSVATSMMLANAQTTVDLESFSLASESYWDGKYGTPGSFIMDDAVFQNNYDFDYDYWSAGFAVSNITDDTQTGYGGLYIAQPFIGNTSSANYTIGQRDAEITFIEVKSIQSVYISNNVYAYTSMRDGDSFAKQFGGSSGDDPDWFLLTIEGFDLADNSVGTVEFYLADYRFSDNLQDYIVDAWTLVDLSSLGNVKKLKFSLTSSDVGSFGMNTPAFFALDDLTYSNAVLSSNELSKNDVKIYPNPVKDFVVIENVGLNSDVKLLNAFGALIYQEKSTSSQLKINASNLENAVYILTIDGVTHKIVKQ